jgi:hypothetical protein
MEILIKSLKSDNIPNLLIHGSKNIDKNKIIFDIFNININHTKKITEYIYSQNNIYLINSTLLKNDINDIIKIIKSKKNKLNYMIFLSFDTSKNILQRKLNIIIEKYRITTIFIFIADKYNLIENSIKSRCLPIRLSEKDFSKKYSEYLINFKSPEKIYVENLFVLFNKDYDKITISDIKNIKIISGDILKYHVNIDDFTKELINSCCLNHKWIYKIKKKFIDYITDFQFIYIKSYKKLIHIESLLINLYYLTTNHYKINRDYKEHIHVL